jgi:DMATS type aromatic prenyltransferase
MMQYANYDQPSQLEILKFYSSNVVPAMGKCPLQDGRPRGWKSFMTDDHTPIELSYSWGVKRENPTVRFSIEPIGTAAGQETDPLNLQAYREYPDRAVMLSKDIDLEWFNRLSEAVMVTDTDKIDLSQLLAQNTDHRSQFFAAFDLESAKMVSKAYFLPVLKSTVTKKSTTTLVKDAVFALAQSQPAMLKAAEMLFQFIESRPAAEQVKVEIVGIDCLEPSRSRIKVYVRSLPTAFQDVRSMMTLDGQLASPDQEGQENLKELWDLVLALDPKVSETEPLRANQHRTAGTLYYFELRPDRAYPQSKVYIPVRHYGQNDAQIARGLSTFLEKHFTKSNTQSYAETLQTLL